MCKCNEFGNCSNSRKSFEEGNVDCRASLQNSDTNRNGRNYKDVTKRKDENTMEKNNKNSSSNNTDNNKNDTFKNFEDFLMASHLAPLGFITGTNISDLASIFGGECPFFDETREKCKKCHCNPSNKNDSSDSDEKKPEVPSFLQFLREMHEDLEKAMKEDTEEEQGGQKSSETNDYIFKDGKKIPFGEVLAHIANSIDKVQISIDEMSDMFDGELIEGEPIQLEGFNFDGTLDDIKHKIKKVNRRITILDNKFDRFMEMMPDIIAKAVVKEMKEVGKTDSKSK